MQLSPCNHKEENLTFLTFFPREARQTSTLSGDVVAGGVVHAPARLGTIEPVRALGAGLGACWPDVAGRTAALPRHDVAGGAVLARTLLPTLRSVPALLAPAAARAPAVT